ncbi:hypothetical protein BCU94_04155 [Shewanella sp. 10N.286.52.C2]|nr:hypothetical protein BCU94_04155 [Shewanella sp. 10N.286.52.C2]PMH86678.1 hypothetical protein BCU57_11135 [Shewanella sp. 10N.286.48.B5]PMH95135.1 hypothetical protein BCU55_02845 [Shewanella sp. 10N.286.48.A6]
MLDWKGEKFIAHEAAEDNKRMMSTQQLMKFFETSIMGMAVRIADGNQSVLDFTRMLKCTCKEAKTLSWLLCHCVFVHWRILGQS